MSIAARMNTAVAPHASAVAMIASNSPLLSAPKLKQRIQNLAKLMIQDRSTRFIVGLGSHACAMGV
jgi:hypothetical protein